MAEKTLTKDEWAQVADRLSGYTGKVQLVVDGIKITFQRGLVKKNQLGIMCWVKGEFEVKWTDYSDQTPESRYMRVISKYKWTNTSRANMKKMSKRKLKQLGVNPDDKHYGLTPFWNNVTQIRRHYEKTFNSIELVEVSSI